MPSHLRFSVRPVPATLFQMANEREASFPSNTVGCVKHSPLNACFLGASKVFYVRQLTKLEQKKAEVEV